MVPDFARVGFTAEIPLPDQGFPARFLGIGVGVGGDGATVLTIGWFVFPVLAGGMLLFLLLPRCFSANY